MSREDITTDTAYSIGNDQFIVVDIERKRGKRTSVKIYRLNEEQLSAWGIIHRVQKWDELAIN